MNTVKYRYNQQGQPLATFVYVVNHYPARQTAAERLPALLDHGSDIAAVPAIAADQLVFKNSNAVLA